MRVLPNYKFLTPNHSLYNLTQLPEPRLQLQTNRGLDTESHSFLRTSYLSRDIPGKTQKKRRGLRSLARLISCTFRKPQRFYGNKYICLRVVVRNLI